ncbi:terpene synthase family protein [Nocardia thraciensis]
MTNSNDELRTGYRPEHRVPAALRVPVVEDQFVRQWHRYRWALRRTTMRWMSDQGLLPDTVADTYTDDLLCYTDLISGYYVGESESVVQAIADFSVWFFLWDDRHSLFARRRADQQWWELSTTLRQALHRPPHYRHHPDPLVAAFADSAGRFFGHLEPAWDDRFTEHMNGIFDAYDREYRNLTNNSIPTVAEYLQLRRWTFGHDVWIDLLELTAGHTLPPSIRMHDVYRIAAHSSQEFASTYNDLCSLSKEVSVGDIHNLGISLMHHQGLDTRRATAAVRDHADNCVRRFLDAESRIPSLWRTAGSSGEAVRSCVFNMRNWISSTYWFHHESGRYRTQEWPDPAWPPYIDTGTGGIP